MSTAKNSYIRFLNCIEALEEKDATKKLDTIQEQILNEIMRAYSQEREVLVGDLIHLSRIGSQATLHGRVKNLAALGYVKLVTDKVDGRKKKVVPTKLAIKHYEDLAKLLIKVATT